MRITLFLLVTIFVQISFASDAQQITLHKGVIPFEQAMQEIQKQTNYEFIYTDEMLAGTRPVTLNFNNASLEQVLHECFRGQPLTYFIRKSMIVLQRKPVSQKQMPLLSKALPSDTVTIIRGVVTDEKGVTLPGVSVQAKGTSSMTTTNTEGEYVLKVPSSAKELIFKYVGMEPLTLVIGRRVQINVTLRASITTLNDVVVIGYGAVRRAEVTSAISSISEKDIKDLPVSSVEQAMQGKVSGVSISSNGGQPGGGISVKVRGITSVNGNDPLYVVDGVPLAFGSSTNYNAGGAAAAQTAQSALSAINPDDIASVDILKDASAQAIYGSRAANGVVIITTKHGKQGESKVTYDTYFGTQQLQKKLDMMNLSQFAQYENQTLQQIATVNATTYTPIPEYADPSILGPGTDWQEGLFQRGNMQNHQLAFSGGSDKATYYTSLNYFDQNGIVIGSGLKRYSLRINIDQHVNSWLKFGVSSTLTKSDQLVSLTNGSATPISIAVGNSPAAPIYLNGQFAPAIQVGGYQFGSNTNPLALASLQKVTAGFNKAVANIYGEANIAKGLTFRSQFGFDFSLNQNTFYQPQVYNGVIPIIPQSSINEDRGIGLFYNVSNYLNYNRTFGKHNVSLQAGQEAWVSTYNDLSGSRLNLNLNLESIAAGATTGQTSGGGKYQSAMASYFGRVGYVFDNRYSFNASLRRDGASNFGPNNRYGYFPAASAGWTVTNEKFASNWKNLNYLKLRLGVGEVGGVGNSGTAPYSARLFQQNGAFGPGSWPANVPNPFLKWEAVRTYNAGLDATLIDRKVELTVDVYKKITTDMILSSSLPSYTGIGTNYNDIQAPVVNAGQMTNTGVDISLTSYNVNTSNFSWKTTVIFSHYQNILNKLNSGSSVIYYSATDALNTSRIVTASMVGKPVGEFYGFVTDGIFRSANQILSSPDQGLAVTPKGTWVGDVKYKDISGPNGKPDGVIDSYDETVIGNPNPKFTYGLTNNFTYKGFDLNVFLQGNYGSKILNFTKLITEGEYNVYNNQLVDVLRNAYSPANPNGTLPRYNEWNENNRRLSDRFIEDGSYLRIQNVTLGYNFPKQLIKKAKLSAARLFISGQNLYTFTKYSGYDPELGSFNNNALYTNVDNGNYPNPRTFTIGANLTF
jgi:TonB-linked SusC/RagA family outer membrane protein